MGTDAATLRDLAGEIEWAKASLVAPAEYPAAVARLRRDVPGPAEQVAAVYAGYEEAKNAAELLDFDDLLLHVAGALEEHADIAQEFRDRYRCFVVDEYQDVTPLQQRVLDAWLGERDDLTVVGDANQTIYTFAGRQPEAPAGVPAALPRGRRRAAAARLPLHPAGRRVRQHAHRRGPRPARGHPAAADRPAPGGSRPGFHRARRRGRRGRRGRHPHPADGRRRGAAERDRRAVPDQRAVRGLRAGAHRGGRALPGARRRAVLRPARDPPGDERRPHGGGGHGCLGRRRARRAGARRPHPGSARRRGPAGAVGVAARARRAGRGARGRRAGCRPPPLRRRARDPGRRARTRPPSRASRSRRCTRRRAWSGTPCSWSGSSTARCRSSTPRRRARDRGGAPAALRRHHPGPAAGAAVVGARPAAGRGAAASAQPLPLRARARAPPGVAHRPRRTRRGQAALPGLRFAARSGSTR